MRLQAFRLCVVILATCLPTTIAGESRFDRAPSSPQTAGKPVNPTLQPNSLCTKGEHIIFSCRLKRPAKIVSLCASKDLARKRGYLQYRFGLPARVELEFPKDRKGTQEQFQYTHYFRFQVDLTEINFSIDGNQYQIFDAYNGEEKPVSDEQGVTVTPSNKPKAITYNCRTTPKADYSKLPEVLSNQP